MRKKLLTLLFLLVTTFTVTIIPEPQTVKADNNCAVVGQVCRDISNMLYDMCIVGGGTLSACALMEANNTINCITANGCDPHHD